MSKELPPYNPLEESLQTGTPTRWEMANPDKAAIALDMLSMGAGLRDISNHTGCTFEQLAALRARHEIAIEIRRKQLAQDGFELVEGMRLILKEKMRMIAEDPEVLKKTPLIHITTGYGILQDKSFQAQEGNKTIVEHVQKRPSLADAQKAINEAKAQIREQMIKTATPVEATSVETTSVEEPKKE